MPAPTPKRAIGLELFEKKKVKVGDNTITLHGIGLAVPAAENVLINMQLSLPEYLWFPDHATIVSTASSITFNALLVEPSKKAKAVSSDSGDLTIAHLLRRR
jgi:hypothetical protein